MQGPAFIAISAHAGAWLELTQDKPQTPSRIQITFDTGFHRQLMRTAQSIRWHITATNGDELARVYEEPCYA
ncbi:MAG: hypothetical protein NTV49_15365 [Kiritimatiellaeota bacterium]|nr:hypothetical protein [Kiritimatiellota bacterium]